MGAASLLRAKLHAVQQKIDKSKKKGRKAKDGDETTFTAEEAVLRDLLTRKNRLRTHVHKIDDVAALLRIVDEFGLDTTVEHAMDVHQPGIFRELKRRGISVTYGPIDSFAYKVELKHESWRNVQHLVDSGVEFGLMTDHPVTPARQLFLQTRWFTRFGLTKHDPGHHRLPRYGRKGEVGVFYLLERGPLRYHRPPRAGRRGGEDRLRGLRPTSSPAPLENPAGRARLGSPVGFVSLVRGASS